MQARGRGLDDLSSTTVVPVTMTISTRKASPNQARGEGEEMVAQPLGLGGTAALGGDGVGGSPPGKRGAARVWWRRRWCAGGMGRQPQGWCAPLPSPPYIGGRLGLGQGAGRPPLLAPQVGVHLGLLLGPFLKGGGPTPSPTRSGIPPFS